MADAEVELTVPPDGEPGSSSTEVMTVGKIERVPLREVWPHEAYNLTTWLQQNIDVLNDVLGINLVNIEREQAAGSFSVDLVGEDDNGATVVIENQLERSNHDHLGKLITYTAFMDARTAIWIVSEPRPEHVRAISWLNDAAPADFYLLKLEGIRIANSPPAPLLTLIVGPSEEGREVGTTKKIRAERDHIVRRFWTSLLEAAKEQTPLHRSVSPSERTWIGISAGKPASFAYVVMQHDARVELYMRGNTPEDDNRRIFDALHEHKAEIEEAFGGELSWERNVGERNCRIAKRIPGGGYDDEARWPEIQEAMVGAMVRLHKALIPFLSPLVTQ